MVEFTDGSTLAQLGYSNMCFPIQYAVTWPDRVPSSLPPLDFSKLSSLEFYTPRCDDFPALNLARRAVRSARYSCDECRQRKLLQRFWAPGAFPDIWNMVEQVMDHTSVAHADLDAILNADQWAREQARESVRRGDERRPACTWFL
jgi:1-deoxy-D-xylulose-5-phosphate reductoisomerase